MENFNIMSAFDNFKLTEDIFEADEFKDFIDNDEDEQTIDVIDLEAGDEEEVSSSYIGDAVIVCPVCNNAFFKKSDEIVIADDEDEAKEGDIVNKEDECPICGNVDGYHLVGKVVPYTEVEVTVEPKEEEGEAEEEEPEAEDDKVEEALETETKIEEGCEGDSCKEGNVEEVKEEEKEEDTEEDVIESLQNALSKFAKKLKEEIETVSVDDDKTKVTVDVKKSDDEMGIAPVEPDEFGGVDDIKDDDFAEDEMEDDGMADEDEFIDVDVDEVEEESLSREILRSRPQFESYRVRKIEKKGNDIYVESIARKRNKSVIRECLKLVPHGKTKDKVLFVAKTNSPIRNKGFMVECKLNNKKLIVESFKRR